MNEYTPNQPAPQPPPVSSQSRGLAVPYATFSAAGGMNANVVNLASTDRAKSFQGAPRAGVTAKYQLHPHQLQQVNEYHTGPYASSNYPLHKSPVDNRTTGHNGGKFDYANQQYSPQPPPQQQSYVATYGYPSYAQTYSTSGDYQQHQQQQQQQQQQHTQQYHGGYTQVEANPLGMLATNAQASTDAMPHEPINIGLKDVAHRKYRQSYSVVPNDSFLNSSNGYVHGIERPGNVVQIKTNPSNTQQSMYQRSNLFSGNTAFYSQQQVQQQQRTQSTQQHNLLDLGPSSASYEANGNGGVSSGMGRSMNNSVGGLFSTGSRMPQYSPNASTSSLTTRLKDGGVDISIGASSNGSHLSFLQQPTAKSHDLAQSTSLYGDVANSATSMSMEGPPSDGSASASVNANALYVPSSLIPSSSQLNTSAETTCGLCSGAHSDRIANHCGHRFHAQCLHSWGGLTTCPICAQASNTITGLSQNVSGTSYGLGGDNVTIAQAGDMPINSGNSLNAANPGSNAVPISPHAMGPSQMTTINISQVNSGGRPPPIDTRIGDHRVGSTTLSGGKRSATSTRSGSSSGGRVRKNKKLKDCSVPGCDRTVRSRGLCKGHGGGRRCGFTGCGLSDQGGGFCISHGGGKRCQHEGCDNSAQSRGLCKLHGGGSRCTVPNCTKSSQGRGLCRAHGGGRRCMVEGCNKTDRRAGYCVTHGADKKCIIAECSKTGRIDNMCTKHYFERHPAQPPGTVSTTPPPVITVNANTSAARARAERKRAAEQQAVATHYTGMSSAMLGSVPNTTFVDERVGGTMSKTGPF